jgi:hemolysin activation/secretion protein
MKIVLPFPLCCALIAVAPHPALAQSAPLQLPVNIGDAVRQADEARAAAPPRPTAQPIVPQIAEAPFALGGTQKLFVRRFQLEGELPTDDEEARALLAPYEGRKLTIAEIYAAADKITALYRARGYVVAKAYVPAQDARKGTLRLKIVAGRYGERTLKNESLVNDDFVRGVIDSALAGSPIIHKDAIERSLLMVSDLPGAGVPRIVVSPGKVQETTDFLYAVPEGRRIDGYLLADNYGSPYTGRDRLNGALNVNSLLGVSDRLQLSGVVSERAHLASGRVAYGFPLGYDGLRGEIGAYRTTYALGGVYKDLNAAGTAYAVTAGLSYPIRRSRDENIFVAANFQYKWLNDKISDSSTAYRGIALGALSVNRDAFYAVFGFPVATSASLGLSIGDVAFPDALQALQNQRGANTEGSFAKLNLSTNATIGLTEQISFATSLRAQKSLSRNLDTSEQIGISGFFGVRSFDEGLSGDSGFLVTPQLSYALPEFYGLRHSASVFVDFGGAWLEDASYTVTQKSYTPANDFGLSYHAAYEYAAGRVLTVKAEVAHSFGPHESQLNYDRQTKGLVQFGLTF